MNTKVIGWIEDVSLPLLNLGTIKAKMDTGAKSSALHAESIKYLEIDNKKYVSFSFAQEDGQESILQALFVGERSIKSSTGQVTVRPVINTIIKIGSDEFDIEFTLINRSAMRYKIIIGRDALRYKYIINPAEPTY
jgi:hypothetical protein